jgi:hypothetical protein
MGLWNFLSEKLRATQEAKALFHCNHPKTRLVYRVAINGVLQYTRQCQDCYQDTTLFISHKKLSKTEKAGATLRDSDGASKMFQSYLAERRKLQQEAFWKLYGEYLKSAEWADRRAKVLKRDRFACQLHQRGCTRLAEQVHHLTYERVGDEPLEDLISVCVHCHDIVTEDSRQQRIQSSVPSR